MAKNTFRLVRDNNKGRPRNKRQTSKTGWMTREWTATRTSEPRFKLGLCRPPTNSGTEAYRLQSSGLAKYSKLTSLTTKHSSAASQEQSCDVRITGSPFKLS